MRPINLLCLSAAIALLSACGNEKENPSTDASVPAGTIAQSGRDTVPCINCLETSPKDSIDKEPLYDEEISWRDFWSNFQQFDPVRQTLPSAGRTQYVRFDIRKMATYLKTLTDKGINNVDIYYGRYVLSASQPSGTPVPSAHRGKLTVMLAPGAASIDSNNTLPWNVGNPWP